MALLLRRRGIRRVRPLAGGFEAWRRRGFPLDASPRVAESLTGVGPPMTGNESG
ncbi:MAG: hypothetical protein ACRD2Z_13900 [Thermoanaerobaculia bacterium]